MTRDVNSLFFINLVTYWQF